jgi:starch phosphorylase
MFYRQGYFLQRLDRTGWQREEYLQTDVNQLPMQPAIGTNGEPVVVEIATRSGAIRAKVWRVKVGRSTFCCSTRTWPGTRRRIATLTSRLYGGDGRVRIRQELLLGVGGYRALKAMGISPGVLHLNEGHSGFAVFEAIRTAWRTRVSTSTQAASQIPREVMFTTHTPVPPGTTASVPS